MRGARLPGRLMAERTARPFPEMQAAQRRRELIGISRRNV